MEPWSKKTILLLVIVSGVVVVGATGLILKRPLLEQWHLWQVESGGEEQKKVALERLEEMGSVKAVPHFLELILEAQLSTAGRATAVYKVSAILDEVPEAVSSTAQEILLQVMCEIVRAESPVLAGSSRRTYKVITVPAGGPEAIRKGLDTLKRIGSLLDRIGMQAVPQLKKVLLAEDAERLVKLVADLELRLLTEGLKTRGAESGNESEA